MDGYVDEEATKRFNEALQKLQWDDSLFEHTEKRAALLYLNERFRRAVKEIRDRFGIPESGFVLRKDFSSWRRHISDQTDQYGERPEEWNDAVTEILKRSHLMAGWRYAIEDHIFSGNLYAPPSILISDPVDKFGVTQLQLTINDFSGNRDLIKLQNMINNWVDFWGYGSKDTKRQPKPKEDYYFFIYDLRKDGWTCRQIAEVLSEFADEKTTYVEKEVCDDLAYFEALIDRQMD
jgi:hypothetical protein